MSPWLEVSFQALHMGAGWALVAIAFGFVARATNIYNLAIGGLFTIGAYVMYYAAVGFKLPMLASALIGIACAGAVGVLIDFAIYQPVTGLHGRRKRGGLGPFVAALGVLIVIQNTAQLLLGASPLNLTSPDFGVVELAGSRVLGWNLLQTVMSLAAAIAFQMWLFGTRSGVAATARGQSAEGASLVGISERAVRLRIFLFTGLLSGLAGVLAILTSPAVPSDGMPVVLYGALISLMLPSAPVLVWWFVAIAAAFVYSAAITFVGGGWQDVILQSALMSALVMLRVVVPELQRRRAMRHSQSPHQPAMVHSETGSPTNAQRVAETA